MITFIAAAPARDAVSAAARLLDCYDAEVRRHGGEAPPWDAEINPTTLDVEDPFTCPLGQSFGYFWNSPPVADLEIPRFNGFPYPDDAAREIARHRAQVLGLWPLPTPGEEDDREDFGNAGELNRRWREEIALRQRIRDSWALAA